MNQENPLTVAEFEAFTDAADLKDNYTRIALALRRGEQAMELLKEVVGDEDVEGLLTGWTDRADHLLKGIS